MASSVRQGRKSLLKQWIIGSSMIWKSYYIMEFLQDLGSTLDLNGMLYLVSSAIFKYDFPEENI